MSLKEFDNKFNIKTSLEEEKKRFVNRINAKIFDSFYTGIYSYEKQITYSKFFKDFCFILGENHKNFIDLQGYYRSISFVTFGNFTNTLRAIIAVYQCNYETINIHIDSMVPKIIESSGVDLGIKWANGIFYPTGDELLDKELITTALQYLDNFPNEKKDLKNALDNYYSKSLYGVVENCYLAIEGLARNLLDNNNSLIDNKAQIVDFLNFSSSWNKILFNYINYANEFRRHAGEDRHNLKPNEVEAFLYLTCLIIRASLNEKVAK